MPKGTAWGRRPSLSREETEQVKQWRVPGRHFGAGVRSGFAFPWGPMVKRMVWVCPVPLGSSSLP